MARGKTAKVADSSAPATLDGLVVHIEEAAQAFGMDAEKLRTLLNKDAVRSVGGAKYPLLPVIRTAFTFAADDYDQTAGIAGLLGVSHPTVSAMADKGYFARRTDGMISRKDALLGQIKRLQEQVAAKSSKDSKTRVEAARAREIELRIAREEAVLVEAEEVSIKIDAAFGKLREELSGLPARVTRDLQLRKTIETAINEALTQAADAFGSDAAVLEQEAAGDDLEADGNDNQAVEASTA